MNSNSVPNTTEEILRAHLAAKLSSFYLEEIDPKNLDHSGATTLLEHPLFNEDGDVRAIRERYKDDPDTADALLRLLIFVDYKLVQNGETAAPWFENSLVHNPRQPERARNYGKKLLIKYAKDLDCDQEGSLLYSCLWPELNPKEIVDRRFENYVRYQYTFKGEASSLELQGDCMCSAGWPLRHGLKLFLDRLPITDPTLEKILEDDENYRPLIKDFKRAPIPRIIRHDLLSGNEYLRKIWSCGPFLKYLEAAFSRANWTVIPNGLNKPRGSDVMVADYWDRTMERMLADQDWFTTPKTPKSKEPRVEDFRARFQQLLQREWMLPGEDSPIPGYQALLLEDWLYRDEDTGELLPLYLPPRKARGPYPHPAWKDPGPKCFGEWETMLTEMTRRIKNRREKMLDALVNVPTEQLKESGLIPSSFEEEHR